MWQPLEGLASKLTGSSRDAAFRSWPPTVTHVHDGKIIQTASQLTWILAEHLADTIAWLMRSILDHASKILFDKLSLPCCTKLYPKPRLSQPLQHLVENAKHFFNGPHTLQSRRNPIVHHSRIPSSSNENEKPCVPIWWSRQAHHPNKNRSV